MKFSKLVHVEHSGIGREAIHVKVLNKFSVSKEVGIKYCSENNFDVEITESLLTVTQKCEYGFKMIAKLLN